MTDKQFSRDLIMNVIYQGIKPSIDLLFDAGQYRSALILIYSGIDSISYLGMDEGKDYVDKRVFVDWCDQYMDLDGPDDPSGVDLYGARCGMLHLHSPFSKMQKEKKCRPLVYAWERRTITQIAKTPDDPLIVRVEDLRDHFYIGIEKFVVEIFGDEQRRAIAEKRFQKQFLQVRAEDLKFLAHE